MVKSANMTKRAAVLFESIAAVFLAATMLLTIADVALRSLNPEWRIFGVVEMVQFTFDNLVFLAVPAVFLLGQNILVNLFDELVPKIVLRIFIVAGSLTSLIYLGIFFSQIVVTSLDTLQFNDTTQDLYIPLFLYWVPIWIGIGGSFLAECVRLLSGPSTDGQESDTV